MNHLTQPFLDQRAAPHATHADHALSEQAWDSVQEPGTEFVGYESFHPLTWLPARQAEASS